MPDVQIIDAHGRPTSFSLQLTNGTAGNIQINISADFAGRNVDEELPLSVLKNLAGPTPSINNDLLGLTLQSDGENVSILIGVGSGNERCSVTSAALAAALAEF